MSVNDSLRRIPMGMERKSVGSKGQISFEFITMFIVVMLAFLFFFALYSEFNAVTHQSVLKDKAKAAAYDIANAVNAILPSENASMTFSIQHGYSISAGVRSIMARDSENNTGSAPILTDRLYITLPVNATNITVSKTGGMVYIYGS
jgi:zona occludens toxin (predicted ATPase)